MIYFERNNKSGKPVGGDIKEKKMTLPLIYTLNNMGTIERKKTILDIKYRSNKPKVVNRIIDLVNNSGGMDYAQKKMDEHLELAIELLADFEDNTYKNSLIGLVNYSIKRNK